MRNERRDYAVSVGTVLADDMKSANMTQSELSEKANIPKSLLSEIINGKRKISQDVAIKLEKVLGAPAQYWLNIQNEYEIAKKKSGMSLVGVSKTIRTGNKHALDVAHWLINRTARDAEYTGEYLTQLKLQKLLYLVQRESIRKNGEAVFIEPILHWQFGPVVQCVYNAYKDYDSRPIESAPSTNFDEATEYLLEKVYKQFERYSASGLVTITHDKQSWKNTKQNEEMTLEMISFDN